MRKRYDLSQLLNNKPEISFDDVSVVETYRAVNFNFDRAYDYHCDVCKHGWSDYVFWGPVTRVKHYYGCQKCKNTDIRMDVRVLDKLSSEYFLNRKRYILECECITKRYAGF